MNCCQCTCENPTCSCAPVEVTAFKDARGKLHSTKRDAAIADVVECAYIEFNPPGKYTTFTPHVSRYDLERVIKKLAELDFLKIN